MLNVVMAFGESAVSCGEPMCLTVAHYVFR